MFSAVDGLDSRRPGAELYDLALRATRRAESVEHMALDLFARDVAIDPPLDAEALESTRGALLAHLEQTGGGEVRSVGADGVHDTRRTVAGEPLISIVIPTRGQYIEVDGVLRCFVVDAVRSIRAKSTWQNYEIVLVIDSVAEQRVVDELVAIGGPRLRFVVWSKPFNFSEKVNLGVLHADGEYVLLLNDDVEIITPEWIEAMLALAQRPGAGMVGSMLYYADETIQHAGHQYDGGEVSHIGLDAPRGDAGPLNGYRVEREVAGVTAACALMPTKVFREVGGLTNLLPGSFNDVDLCLKTTWQEHEIYWTPHAELYHFESKTRDASVHAFEIDVAWRRWGFRMEESEYWPHAFNRPVA
ncbi:glycosyltransferase family 2 protein [Lysinimonas soli]|uniref:Glycosyltransferase family 2 protein n=1 Tax=Lysinimonas soli TaxID=1074233 RepID=A0ABW0NSK5_9MICO